MFMCVEKKVFIHRYIYVCTSEFIYTFHEVDAFERKLFFQSPKIFALQFKLHPKLFHKNIKTNSLRIFINKYLKQKLCS